MAYEQVKLRIVGKMPMLMHSNRGVNPRDKLAQDLKAVTGKRTKTDEDLDAIQRIEWELGLYYNDDPQRGRVGPCLPPAMLLACMREAAKRSKQGKTVLEALIIDDSVVALDYDGPRDISGLYEDGRFCDLRPARVMGRTVNRSRPIFPAWSASFTVTYDAESIDRADVIRIAEQAGMRVGLGDYRPVHGRFGVEVVEPAKRGRS